METILTTLQKDGFDWERTYNQSPIGILLLDPDFVITRANKAIAEMLGMSDLSELLGMKCYEALGINHSADLCSNPHQTGQIEQIEVVKNQKTLLILETPLYSKTGQIVGHTHSCYDVTEQRKVEREVTEAREKFETIFTHAPIGIIVTDLLSRQILDANNYFCEMLSYSKKELLTLTTIDISHPDDCQISIDRTVKANKDTQSYTLTKRYITKFGLIRWVRVTVAPVVDSVGKIRYAFSIVEDITNLIQK